MSNFIPPPGRVRTLFRQLGDSLPALLPPSPAIPLQTQAAWLQRGWGGLLCSSSPRTGRAELYSAKSSSLEGTEEKEIFLRIHELNTFSMVPLQSLVPAETRDKRSLSFRNQLDFRNVALVITARSGE